MKHRTIETLVLGLLASTVQGDPIQWSVADGGNGHWYEGILASENLTWEEAKKAAEAMGGHLVTMTDLEENDWVRFNIANDESLWHDGLRRGPWFGLHQVKGIWSWVDSTPWNFADQTENQAFPWHPGNPADGPVVSFWAYPGAWQDHPVGAGQYTTNAYLVEWPTRPPVQWKIQDGGNGHWYEAVEDPGILWEDANTTSISMGGYLATPTSAEENQFIYEMIEPIDSMWNSGEWNGPWLGGYQDTNAPDYEEPMGGWRWDTDEVWNFTNWASNQPDDGGAKFTENHLQYWQRDQNTWNDIHTAANVSGFVVEFTTLPGSALGACCLDGLCITTAAADCSGNSGSWGGPDSSCSDFDCPENCPGDLDGNGAVDVTDLLLLMAFWGSCPQHA